MGRLSIAAPAKVNWVLHVGDRRADGFHDIESLFLPLDLCDDIEVVVERESGNSVTVRCPDRPELEGEDNLMIRAARLFQEHFDLSGSIAMSLTKRIPVTAGLGGGSSDAAAVLRALSQLHGLGEGSSRRAELLALASSVGSDVPYFLEAGLEKRAAWVVGRGEQVEPVSFPSTPLLLFYPTDPALAIRAADAYRWLDEDRLAGIAMSRELTRPGADPVAPSESAPGLTTSSDLTVPENDLMAPALRRREQLGQYAHTLAASFGRALHLSGSGPTLYAASARKEPEAWNACYRGLKLTGLKLFNTRSL